MWALDAVQNELPEPGQLRDLMPGQVRRICPDAASGQRAQHQALLNAAAKDGILGTTGPSLEHATGGVHHQEYAANMHAALCRVASP